AMLAGLACTISLLKHHSQLETDIERGNRMSKLVRILVWIVVAVAGALSLATVALHRGEAISAMWLVVAALCTYAVGYRFYSKFIAAKVLTLDAMRATPAERLEN